LYHEQGSILSSASFATLDVLLGLRPSFEAFADPNNQATARSYRSLYFGLGQSSEAPRGFATLKVSGQPDIHRHATSWRSQGLNGGTISNA